MVPINHWWCDMTKIQCFWIEPIAKAKESFRRYAGARYVYNEDGSYKLDDRGRLQIDPNWAKCPGRRSYHNAETPLGVVPWPFEHGGSGLLPSDEERFDPRWPTKCESCPYVFCGDDDWQHNFQQLYERSDTHELMALNDAPVGAMWDASWMGEPFRGPDGICLVVRTPGGDWTVDGNARGGGKWTRTGAPPTVTARPSILIDPTRNDDGKELDPGYHGWLTDGYLVEC